MFSIKIPFAIKIIFKIYGAKFRWVERGLRGWFGTTPKID
jgi:hypothetical protein